MRGRTLPVAALALVVFGSVARAQDLEDPGFENGSFGTWSVYGQDWRISPLTNDTRSGHFAVVNDVLTNNIDIFRVVHRELPVEPGANCGGGAWIRASDVEGSESYFEIQFWDRAGVTLKQYQSKYVTKDQDYAFHAVTNAIAPPDAVSVSVRAVVHMIEAPRKDADHHYFDDLQFTMAKGGGG